MMHHQISLSQSPTKSVIKLTWHCDRCAPHYDNHAPSPNKWISRYWKYIVYAIIGLFGAARYGDQTSDNILQNQWMGGGIGQGILNLSISCMSKSRMVCFLFAWFDVIFFLSCNILQEFSSNLHGSMNPF